MSSDKREIDLGKQAIEKWGVNTQYEMLIEECSEVILAVQKFKRHGGEDRYHDILEEVADVEIMINVIREMVGHQRIDGIKSHKLDKLEKHLNNDSI